MAAKLPGNGFEAVEKVVKGSAAGRTLEVIVSLGVMAAVEGVL
jgi:hypothetical protein